MSFFFMVLVFVSRRRSFIWLANAHPLLPPDSEPSARSPRESEIIFRSWT